MVPRYNTVKTRKVFIYRNPGKTRCIKETGDRSPLPRADLDHQPAARLEIVRRLVRNDAIGREAVRSTIEGNKRIVVAHLPGKAGNGIRFDVGRV